MDVVGKNETACASAAIPSIPEYLTGKSKKAVHVSVMMNMSLGSSLSENNEVLKCASNVFHFYCERRINLKRFVVNFLMNDTKKGSLFASLT